MLNTRLPRITAPDVLPTVLLGDYPFALTPDKPIRVVAFSGARLFNKVCGQARAEINIPGSFLGTVQSSSPPFPARVYSSPLHRPEFDG